ncbi:MAG TPA: phosphoglycerate mutase family protein [Vicinamibacterales bacterium]|jgi:broad specificity phosphatase PhoE
MKPLRVLLVLFALLGVANVSFAADTVIFIVRHAEKAAESQQTPRGSHATERVEGSGVAKPNGQEMMADNPPLSAAGQARAKRLAAALRSAGIHAIYTTEYLRTRQTAAPLAQALKLQPIMIAARDTDTLLQQLRTAKGNVLVVSHADTIPVLLKGLGVKDQVTIGENEWDSLFVVVRSASVEPTFVRLHY